MSTTHYCSTDPGTSFTKDDSYAIGGIVSRPQPPFPATPLDPTARWMVAGGQR